MSRVCLRTINITRLSQAPARRAVRRLHASALSKSAAVVAPTFHLPETNAYITKRNLSEVLGRKKLEDFVKSLDLESLGHRRVWSSYVDLLSFLRPEQISLEIHQKVLRRCTTSLDAARYDLVERMQQRQRIRAGHTHEMRFQAIIHNMRQAGYTPDAEDYHFILQHFAAVGYHLGALQVLKEMGHVGLQKSPMAYELCLRALARRLNLPCWHEDRPKLAAGITRMVFKMLVEMRDNRVELNSRNIDLCLRVVGESLEDEPFEKFMRLAYGVDLTFPDRPPLEFWSQDASTQSSEGPGMFSTLTPYPFTTSTLNSTVEFLGRKGRISKLVQAFEVLSSPLPTAASITRDSAYMDDEDEDFGDDRPEVAPYKPPHAQPNSETYERLIRWTSKANHAPLARHYLYEVYCLDRATNGALRKSLSHLRDRPEEVRIPRAMLTSKMIQSVFGLTNREKKLPMTRWILHRLRKMKNNRRSDIIFYRKFEEKWKQPTEGSEEQAGSGTPTDASQPHSPPATESAELFENQDLVESRLSDVNVHLLVLRREYSRILVLERHMVDVLGRNTQRIKEKLGRRVWASKDIYLRSQGGE